MVQGQGLHLALVSAGLALQLTWRQMADKMDQQCDINGGKCGSTV